MRRHYPFASLKAPWFGGILPALTARGGDPLGRKKNANAPLPELRSCTVRQGMRRSVAADNFRCQRRVFYLLSRPYEHIGNRAAQDVDGTEPGRSGRRY